MERRLCEGFVSHTRVWINESPPPPTPTPAPDSYYFYLLGSFGNTYLRSMRDARTHGFLRSLSAAQQHWKALANLAKRDFSACYFCTSLTVTLSRCSPKL
jgi:hypothetical protein